MSATSCVSNKQCLSGTAGRGLSSPAVLFGDASVFTAIECLDWREFERLPVRLKSSHLAPMNMCGILVVVWCASACSQNTELVDYQDNVDREAV
jgi:hypothetical protein